MPNSVVNRRILFCGTQSAPAQWTPADLTNLAFWVKSDTGVTSSGGLVSSWADQSGNGRNLDQSDAAAKPTVVANQLNGFAAILFDGIANTMRTTNFSLTQPVSIFLIGKHITWTGGDSLFDGTIDNSGRLFQNGSTPEIVQYSGNFGASTTGLVLNTFALVTCIFNGVSSVLQINNNAQSTGDAGNTAMGGFVLGSFATGAVAFANISACEVIIQSSVSTADERLLMQTYVTDRYAISM